MPLNLRQRSNFAVQHLMSAARFARLCHKIEQENEGNRLGSFYDEIISYVTAAVFASVAALEANINETFADAMDGFISFQDLTSTELHKKWHLIERKPTLAKYQYALVMQKKDQMQENDCEYQFAYILIEVRNALVHFKPEWHDQQKKHDEIGEKLKGKFKLSPFVESGSPLFPTRCMTHGFADWSVETSLAFINSFSKKSGFPNRFAKFSNRLKTKAV